MKELRMAFYNQQRDDTGRFRAGECAKYDPSCLQEQVYCPHNYEDLPWGANNYAMYASCKTCELESVVLYKEEEADLHGYRQCSIGCTCGTYAKRSGIGRYWMSFCSWWREMAQRTTESTTRSWYAARCFGGRQGLVPVWSRRAITCNEEMAIQGICIGTNPGIGYCRSTR